MENTLWHDFMERLVDDEDKLKAFCQLDAVDIDEWLLDNDMGITLDQLLTASPDVSLSEDESDKTAFVRYANQRAQKTVKIRAAAQLKTPSIPEETKS